MSFAYSLRTPRGVGQLDTPPIGFSDLKFEAFQAIKMKFSVPVL